MQKAPQSLRLLVFVLLDGSTSILLDLFAKMACKRVRSDTASLPLCPNTNVFEFKDHMTIRERVHTVRESVACSICKTNLCHRCTAGCPSCYRTTMCVNCAQQCASCDYYTCSKPTCVSKKCLTCKAVFCGACKGVCDDCNTVQHCNNCMQACLTCRERWLCNLCLKTNTGVCRECSV